MSPVQAVLASDGTSGFGSARRANADAGQAFFRRQVPFGIGVALAVGVAVCHVPFGFGATHSRPFPQNRSPVGEVTVAFMAFAIQYSSSAPFFSAPIEHPPRMIFEYLPRSLVKVASQVATVPVRM
jgi:hypothetical protein